MDSEETPEDLELSELALRDRSALDDADRIELARYALSLGATTAEVEASEKLDELALDLTLRPRGDATLRQAASGCGVALEKVQRLMESAGLPAAAGALLTNDEADAVRLLADLAPALIGEDATMQVSRVAGHSMTRMAEMLVGVFRLQVQLPYRDAGTRNSEIVKEYSRIAETVLPSFVRTLDAILRHQIVAVTERVWSTDVERSAVTLERSVGFADLVGFTEMATSSSVSELTRVLLEFDQWSTEVVNRLGGQVVKTIGDEVMFVAESASDACRIALDLLDGDSRRLPPVRVGVASGEVISALGDLYGPDVNLAARLVSAADPATVVVSDDVRMGALESGLEFDPLPPLSLKGIPTPVTAYRVRRI